MPVNAPLRIVNTASHLPIDGRVTAGDLLSIVATWAPAIVGILVPVILFLVAERRYGQRFREERRERAEEREQERRRQTRAAERESWQSEFEEIRGYYMRAEKIVGRILAQPNVSRLAADDSELEELEQRFDAVSRRCPPTLGPSLRKASEAIMRLRKIKLATDREVQDAYRQALACGGLEDMGSEWLASALGAKVVEQFSAASELRRATDEVLAGTWKGARRRLSVKVFWPLVSLLPIAANSGTLGQGQSRSSSRDVRSPGRLTGVVVLRSQTGLTGSVRPWTISAAGAWTPPARMKPGDCCMSGGPGCVCLRASRPALAPP